MATFLCSVTGDGSWYARVVLCSITYLKSNLFNSLCEKNIQDNTGLKITNMTLGSLSNDDGNESSKQAIGLDKQNNNCAGVSHFFKYIDYDHDIKVPNFTLIV